ncbi:hypothetical protein CNMCM8686_005148 [Aspergillus fumigatus]|nr:hypothetical protein CNMCM8686_005148 [Aspergillus fumigatus]
MWALACRASSTASFRPASICRRWVALQLEWMGNEVTAPASQEKKTGSWGVARAAMGTGHFLIGGKS